jgi:outer membrane protein assembly factor BamB
MELNATTGKPGWLFTPASGGGLLNTPVVANGLVLIGSDDFSLYAIRV